MPVDQRPTDTLTKAHFSADCSRFAISLMLLTVTWSGIPLDVSVWLWVSVAVFGAIGVSLLAHAVRMLVIGDFSREGRERMRAVRKAMPRCGEMARLVAGIIAVAFVFAGLGWQIWTTNAPDNETLLLNDSGQSITIGGVEYTRTATKVSLRREPDGPYEYSDMSLYEANHRLVDLARHGATRTLLLALGHALLCLALPAGHRVVKVAAAAKGASAPTAGEAAVA